MGYEIITLTGLERELIPPDTPTFLTDRTWEDILVNLHNGIPLTKTLSNMECKPDVAGRVMAWIYKNSERKALFLNALEAQSEILGQEILDIANGTYVDSMNDAIVPEDIKRSSLRVKVRMWLMEKNNKRFTPKNISQLEIIDLNKAMEAAEKNITLVSE